MENNNRLLINAENNSKIVPVPGDSELCNQLLLVSDVEAEMQLLVRDVVRVAACARQT